MIDDVPLKAWEVLVVAVVVATAFLVTDLMQPIVVNCYSHGEPNCQRLDELIDAARAQRSFMGPMLVAGIAGLAASAALWLRRAPRDRPNQPSGEGEYLERRP